MDAVLSFWGLPPKSSKCLDVAWPKRIPWGSGGNQISLHKELFGSTTVDAGGKGGSSFHLTQPS